MKSLTCDLHNLNRIKASNRRFNLKKRSEKWKIKLRNLSFKMTSKKTKYSKRKKENLTMK